MATRRICPRDKKLLRGVVVGDATVEICGVCAGTFFDAEDLMAAGGVIADPSTWDRAETGGAVKPGALACPHCEATMDAQDVTHDGKHVEVDRCGKCRGVWLDKGELDTLVAIGSSLHAVVEAERAKAREELLALEQAGGTDFTKRSPAEKRTLLVTAAIALALIAGAGIYGYLASRPVPRARPNEDLKEGGCPCGCDHSAAMAAELRRKADADALAEIEATLVTIGRREDAGYVTERMIEHRLRMLDVSGEIVARRPEPPGSFPELDRLVAGTPRSASSRCMSPRIEKGGLRVCTELAIHGERVEIVKGAEKLITSSFRLWVELENLGAEPRTVGVPSIDVPAIRLPVARWYREGSAGHPFDGIVRGGERVRVNVIGDIPDRVMPRSSIDATIRVDTVEVRVTTEARAVIHLAQR